MTYLLLIYAVLATGNVQYAIAPQNYDDGDTCRHIGEYTIVNTLPPSVDGSQWQHVCIGVSAVERESEAPEPAEPKAAPTRAT